jgi:hypothetical protein
MTRSVAVAIILALMLAGGRARADIYYAVTTTGTIVTGYDAGVFGGLGNLAGDTFSALEVFDATTASFSSIPGLASINPAAANVLLSVNGHDLVINGDPASDILFLADTLHLFGNNGVNQDEIYSEVEDSAGDFFASGLASTTIDFLMSDNLAQDLTYTLPGSGAVSFGESLSSQEVFIGSVSSVSLTVIPEPASIAIFGIGLVALGLSRRAAKRV